MPHAGPPENPWIIHCGEGPLVAAAIHHGHFVRPEVESLLAVGDDTRLREEDPYTASWTDVAPTRIYGTRSRFEFDLNRPPEKAVYLRPDDAWGIQVWKSPPPAEVIAASKRLYEQFYDEVRRLLEEMTGRHRRVVIFDLHSYNHRRQGADGPPADPEQNPQINVGTKSVDGGKWGKVVDRFVERMRTFDYPGGKLDVRENVKFSGGHFPRWINGRFPGSACAIAVEVKKFFMDEWTSEVNAGQWQAVRAALRFAAEGVLSELENP